MARFRWTFTIAKVRGIPVRIHLTLLLFLWVLSVDQSDSLRDALGEFLFSASIFACILLHELGHALTAARFGIGTRDITLYPFGGIASITARPSSRAELVIAVAGPAVNVVLATILFFFISIEDLTIAPTPLSRLFLSNIMLAVFNMIPALPMDGGRVLRALLDIAGVRNATLICSRISQVLSIGLGIIGILSGQMTLLLVAIVVFTGAMQEQIHVETRRAVHGNTARIAMIPADRLQSFSHGTTVSQALTAVLTSLQNLFPVTYGANLMGVLEKDRLIDFAAAGGPETYISEVMTRDYPVIGINDDLADIIARPEFEGREYFAVIERGKFEGLLIREKVMEFLLVNELKRRVRELPHDVESSGSLL